MGLDLSGFGSAFDLAKNVIDKIWPPEADPNEKLRVQQELAETINKRESTIIDAQKEIITAELQQGDLFTKRARPMVVYVGLACILLIHVLFPMIASLVGIFQIGSLTPAQVVSLNELKEVSLPSQFWACWGSVISIWSIGRSAEKRGFSNKVISLINGR